MFSGPCAVFSVCPAAVTAVAHLVCPGTVLDCRVAGAGQLLHRPLHPGSRPSL